MNCDAWWARHSYPDILWLERWLALIVVTVTIDREVSPPTRVRPTDLHAVTYKCHTQCMQCSYRPAHFWHLLLLFSDRTNHLSNASSPFMFFRTGRGGQPTFDMLHDPLCSYIRQPTQHASSLTFLHRIAHLQHASSLMFIHRRANLQHASSLMFIHRTTHLWFVAWSLMFLYRRAHLQHASSLFIHRISHLQHLSSEFCSYIWHSTCDMWHVYDSLFSQMG